jgi:hypothetical protein
MRFDVVTLFPELFAPFRSTGVTRRAFASGAVDVRLWRCATSPMTPTGASTIAPTAAGRAW